MAKGPTRGEFAGALLAERRALAGFVQGLTPEQWEAPSDCEGWPVGEVAAHLIVLEQRLRNIFAGTFMHRSFRESVDAVQQLEAQRGPEYVAARLRSGKLPRVFRLGGAIGRKISYAENIAHGQDMRRPLGVARSFEPSEPLLWPALETVARAQRNQLPKGRLRLQSETGSSVTLERRLPLAKVVRDEGASEATVRGATLDVLLFMTGRQASVTIEGEGPLADALRSKPLKL